MGTGIRFCWPTFLDMRVAFGIISLGGHARVLTGRRYLAAAVVCRIDSLRGNPKILWPNFHLHRNLRSRRTFAATPDQSGLKSCLVFRAHVGAYSYDFRRTTLWTSRQRPSRSRSGALRRALAILGKATRTPPEPRCSVPSDASIRPDYVRLHSLGGVGQLPRATGQVPS
jgi:hypothetical protein